MKSKAERKKDRAQSISDAVVDQKMNSDARATHKGMAKKRNMQNDFLKMLTSEMPKMMYGGMAKKKPMYSKGGMSKKK